MIVNDHTLTLTVSGISAVTLFMILGWLFSLKAKDASLVDRLWGLNFILLAGAYLLETPVPYWRHGVALGLLILWGGRLSLHIHLRNRGHPEDYRYQAMRRERGDSFWWVSLFSVFLLQGGLAFLINAPILWVFAGTAVDFNLLDGIALLVWLVGYYFEVVGDWQLKAFKAKPENKGKILDQGLWALTRHPNYFGDAMMWWGLYLLACSVPGGWVTFFGPLIMSFFLRYVSGVTLLEKSLSETKPGYAEYVQKTPAFIPKLSALFKKH